MSETPLRNLEWIWSTDHGQLGQVIEAQNLWGEMICRVWLPLTGSIVRIPASRLKPLNRSNTISPDFITYIASAARITEAISQDVLLAPIEASVIPLPHQIHVLKRAISGSRIRYLLADEVGLGKTIEAGLILRELKLRGRVRRTLIVVPKGLISQWLSEMKTHFHEDFHVLIPSEFPTYRRILRTENIWKAYSQIICPIDSVKPLESRKGWNQQDVDQYNRERFADLVEANWDLIIVDEAHRLGGSTEQVARYKLGKELADASPYLLLLSATPHQGKTDAFHRLVSLLDKDAFPEMGTVTKDRIKPYVIRTEKRKAIDSRGAPLFTPRKTQLIPISWGEEHRRQRLLYEAVTEYVRQGYNQAIKERKNYIGFLMLLMQRMVTSSTKAIATAMERRLEVLKEPEEQLSLFPMLTEDEWADLDGQEQSETIIQARFKALQNEREEVKFLIEATEAVGNAHTDAKAEALLDWIYRLQREEQDPELKVLIFTEFVATQEMLRQFLSERDFSVICLNGSLGLDERVVVQERFAQQDRVLISTDAGGEGLNLQFCHVVVNYDIPWNPMRLEQRIGRVDRIGQKYVVRALNFLLQDTVEFRIREVIEQKLAVIQEEFGIDKTGDILDSVDAGSIFDKIYIDSILEPQNIEKHVEDTLRRIREQASESKQTRSLFFQDEDFTTEETQRIINHPFPHWVERMTVSYLSLYGGMAEKVNGCWHIRWPDGNELKRAAFSIPDSSTSSSCHHLTIDDSHVKKILSPLPSFVPGLPICIVALPGLSQEIHGYWALSLVRIKADKRRDQRFMPLFVHDDGRSLGPSAKYVWDALLTDSVEVIDVLEGEKSIEIYERIRKMAESQGKLLFDELVNNHHESLEKETEKMNYSFSLRKQAVERIGLDSVRSHRIRKLEEEQQKWFREVENRKQIIPQLEILLIIRLGVLIS